MPRSPLSNLSVVLTFLRSGMGWSQAELADTAGIPRSLLNGYESGKKNLLRPRLEHLVSFLGLPPETIDRTLACLEANRAATRAPRDSSGQLSPAQRSVEALAVKAGRLMEDFARHAASLLTFEGECLEARQKAETLWNRLKRKPADQLLLVEKTRKFRTWALVERVAAESIAVAPKSPADALKLAELAVRIAELCPGEDWLRSRAQGYAWFHVSNARRASSNLAGAEAACGTANRLWEAGVSDPGYFSQAIVLALEATLRIDQRRFPLALRRIEEALMSEAPDLRGKLLLTKAQALEALGDTGSSTEVLREALSYIDERREPRTALGVRYQLLTNLCLDNRAPEAAVGLPAVRALAERLGQEIDLVRVLWLGGAVAAGCHQVEEAETAFEQARQQFAAFAPPMAFDYSLVSLNLALLCLEQNRTAEVIPLAEQAVSLFKNYGVQREALAALQVYCGAARRHAATVELTKRVIRYFHRLQHAPELSFTDEETETEG